MTTPRLYRDVVVRSVEQLEGLFCEREEEGNEVSSSISVSLLFSFTLSPSDASHLDLLLSRALSRLESTISSHPVRSKISSSTSLPSLPQARFTPSSSPIPGSKARTPSPSIAFGYRYRTGAENFSRSYTPPSSLIWTQLAWSTTSAPLSLPVEARLRSTLLLLSSNDGLVSRSWISRGFFPSQGVSTDLERSLLSLLPLWTVTDGSFDSTSQPSSHPDSPPSSISSTHPLRSSNQQFFRWTCSEDSSSLSSERTRRRGRRGRQFGD